MNKKRFTLIELLVVIAILGILSSMVMPALAKSQAKSKQTAGKNNLKQVGANIMAYLGSQSSRPIPDYPNIDEAYSEPPKHVADIPGIITGENAAFEGLPATDPFWGTGYFYSYTWTLAGTEAHPVHFSGDVIFIHNSIGQFNLAGARAKKYKPLKFYCLRGDMSVGDQPVTAAKIPGGRNTLLWDFSRWAL